MLKTIFKLCITLFSIVNSQDCFLTVPSDPLNTGLFAPWFVDTNPISTTNCSQLIPGSEVFVEATIFDIDTNKFFVYYPLVIDINTIPAIIPTVVPLPINNIVVIHVGINGNSVTLLPTNDSIVIGNCVNGLPDGSVFGQFAYCNGVNFFKKVNENIKAGLLTIPPILNTVLGDVCPTTRNFEIVDQDQSDNVLSQYIVTQDGKVAQDTPENRNTLNVLKIIANGSDNRLLSVFIAPAIGCKSFTAPNLGNNTIEESSVALNEIQANLLDVNNTNVALVPSFNPMVLDNNMQSILKVNLYRDGVNQPRIFELNNNENINYCNKMGELTPPFLIKYQIELANMRSPSPNIANNLLNFMASRFENSWQILNCQTLIGIPSPIIAIVDPNTGIVISNNLIQQTTIPQTTIPQTTIPQTTIPQTTIPQTTIPQTTISTVPNTSSGQVTTYTIQPSLPCISTVTQTISTTNIATNTPTNTPTVTDIGTTTLIPTMTFATNYTNFCGNRETNINCTEPCPTGLDSECITPGFQCYIVDQNRIINCNVFNYCGNNITSLKCNEPCPMGLDSECNIINGDKCFKDNDNICNITLSTLISGDPYPTKFSGNISITTEPQINDSSKYIHNKYLLFLISFLSLFI